MSRVFPSMQFTSLEFHFVAADGRPVRVAVPLHVLRGLFMSAVAAVQPALAATIHDAGTLSEFSAQLHVERENVFVTYNLFSKRLNEGACGFIILMVKKKLKEGMLVRFLTIPSKPTPSPKWFCRRSSIKDLLCFSLNVSEQLIYLSIQVLTPLLEFYDEDNVPMRIILVRKQNNITWD
nr:hypothetical protein [Candidatus Sigynarchaeum springense]